MITIVYWSGTGNTEAMAEAVAKGAKREGAEVRVLPVSEADASVLESDVVLFGCPAMGSEELEESEFEPFFAAVEGELKGKKIGLFGSYEWADGEWMHPMRMRLRHVKRLAGSLRGNRRTYATERNAGTELCLHARQWKTGIPRMKLNG